MPIWLNLCAAVTSGIIAALLGFVLIPFLRRIHFGQTILDEGPAWHKSKQGTPIMGGFLFIIGSIAATALGYTVWRIMGGTDQTAHIDRFRSDDYARRRRTGNGAAIDTHDSTNTIDV